jgi:mycothiol system anti-sigma-R factor
MSNEFDSNEPLGSDRPSSHNFGNSAQHVLSSQRVSPGDRFDPFGVVDPLLVFDCNAMLARLYSFLDGELNDERRAKIQHHLDDCPSCFSKFDFEAELRIVIAKRMVVRVPESLVERIRISICTSFDES